MLRLLLRQTQQGHKTCGLGNHDTAEVGGTEEWRDGRRKTRRGEGGREERVRKQVCDKESTSGGEERKELGDKRESE